MRSTLRVWVRHGTGWLTALLALAVISLAVHRARTISIQVAEVAGEVPLSDEPGDGETVGVYHGFKYVETVAGRVAFALNSTRTLGLSSGWHEIKDVQLDLHREGKLAAVLTCEAASFNVQTRDARLAGKVRLKLPGGGMVTTEKGRFESGNRELVTEAETVYMSDRVIGRTARARYSVLDDVLTLEEGVVVHSVEGVTMTAPSLQYRRLAGVVEMSEGCRIRFAQGSLDAPRARVELDLDGGAPRLVELRGGVTMTGLERATTVDGWAEVLLARRDAGGTWQFLATTSAPWVTLVAREERSFYERRLSTWRLRGVVGESGILTAVAEDVACLAEIPVEDSPRRSESGRAQIWFEEGTITDLELDHRVVMVSDDLRASAARARVASQSGLVMLHAAPTGAQRAVVTSGQGQVTADQVQLREREQIAEARGNVQGRVDDATLLGGEAPPAQSTVHFAADHLTVSDGGTTFELDGNSRAWQGPRLLQGDSLTFRQRDQSVTAVGHVRTTVPAGEGRGEGLAGAGDAVVEARSLEYSATDRTAVYRGGVRYRDNLRRLSAAELVVVVDGEGRPGSLEATGGVEVVDLASGRRMTGQRARREAATRVVTLVGEPVQLSDAQGNTVSGSSLTWDEASGRVAISGSPEAPTETVYFPSPPPGELPGGRGGEGAVTPTPGPREGR